MPAYQIETDAEYRDALREIEALMAAEPGTEAGRRLDVLVTLVEEYERAEYPMDALMRTGNE